MLSFGIEYERAFSIAFCSARFAAGSGPPSRAATMIARASFENSLPRLASAAPFLCLIELHLLCPDMTHLPDEVEEALVDPGVVRQLRMEGGDDHTPLAQEHRFAVELGEHLDLRPDFADARRADEDAPQGLSLAHQGQVCLEARDLPSIRVPVDVDVNGAEMSAVEHDHPRAGAEEGAGELAHRLVEAVEPHQAHERGRLAARDDQPIEPLQLLRLADLDGVGAEPTKHRRVLAEVSLDCQDADRHDADCRFGLEELGARDRVAAAPREHLRDRDEDKSQDGVRECSAPRAVVTLVEPLEPEEREEHEAKRKVGKDSDRRPLPGEVRGHLQEPPGCEDDPARAEYAVPEQDVSECRDSNHDPVPVAVMEEPEEAAADREARHHVEPESVDPRPLAIRGHGDAQQHQAVGDRHDRGPVPAARDEIRDEEPRGSSDDEDEQREAENAESDGSGDHDHELEHEQPKAKAS